MLLMKRLHIVFALLVAMLACGCTSDSFKVDGQLAGLDNNRIRIVYRGADGVIDSDNARYGGYGNIDSAVRHFTQDDPLYHGAHLGWLKLYLPARSAQILRLRPARKTARPRKAPAKK